uniref:Uncharacterized protein n=1 Tax=Nelumbo nucifera TaxID=4432 RepID=A0A822ZV27_NELNU|nr:TPA_asm: hypothetical protein HUJ06_018674 [Nelumbo nucifera]
MTASFHALSLAAVLNNSWNSCWGEYSLAISIYRFDFLKHVVKKLQRGVLSLCRREDKIGDVKEGHFAVFTTGDAEPKEFLIALNYLDNPEFFKLLEKAEREFGFDQKGVLAVVPFQASELHRILLLFFIR